MALNYNVVESKKFRVLSINYVCLKFWLFLIDSSIARGFYIILQDEYFLVKLR